MPPAPTTRRHFLGQCAAGLALAPGARLLAQANSDLTFTGLRLQQVTVRGSNGSEYTLELRLNGNPMYAQTFKLNGNVAIGPGKSMDFAPTTGKWTLYAKAVIASLYQPDQNSRTAQVYYESPRWQNFWVMASNGVGTIHRFGVKAEAVLVNAATKPQQHHLQIQIGQ